MVTLEIETFAQVIDNVAVIAPSCVTYGMNINLNRRKHTLTNPHSNHDRDEQSA